MGLLDWMRGRTSGSSGATEWPPESQRRRLTYYRDGYRLFSGDHAGPLDTDASQFKDYVVANYLGRLTRLKAGRAFGEGVGVDAPEGLDATNAYIDHLYATNRMREVLKRSAIGAGYRGDSFLKVWFDASDGRIHISSIHPSIVFPEWAPLDSTQMTAVNIGQVLREDGTAYLWIERHEMRNGMGWIVNRLWQVKRDDVSGVYRYDPDEDEVELDAISSTANLEAEYETGIDDLLVVHAAHKRSEDGQPWGAAYGFSDYDASLMRLQAALNDNLSGQRDVNRKMVRPIALIPPVRGEDGEIITDIADMQVIFIEPGTDESGVAQSRVLTWDQGTSSVEIERNDLRKLLAIVGDVDTAALEPPETGGAQSGRAIRLGQHQTQAAVREVQDSWDHPVRKVIHVALKLAAAQGEALAWRHEMPAPEMTADQQQEQTETPGAQQLVVPDLEDLVVQWRDGLPEDEMEIIDEQVKMLDGRVQDPLSAIMVLHGISRQEAEEKWGQIQAMSGDGFGDLFPTLPPTDIEGEATSPEPDVDEIVDEFGVTL